MKDDCDFGDIPSDQHSDDGKFGISGGWWACSFADANHTALRDNWISNAAMVIARQLHGKVGKFTGVGQF
jgi:hypothetical protein